VPDALPDCEIPLERKLDTSAQGAASMRMLSKQDTLPHGEARLARRAALSTTGEGGEGPGTTDDLDALLAPR
jgi:hypothetical protein